MVPVTDVDRHYKRAKQAGAQIINPPADYPYCERQYTADDLGGHQWTFSQTMTDVDPQDWGGVLVEYITIYTVESMHRVRSQIPSESSTSVNWPTTCDE